MKKISDLAEISITGVDECLVRLNGKSAYVCAYESDGFRFHSNPFLSEWFETFQKCKDAAIDYLFSNTDILLLLEKYICNLFAIKWTFKHSNNRLTVITQSGSIAVVDISLKVIHTTDVDLQCSLYGFSESLKKFLIVNK